MMNRLISWLWQAYAYCYDGLRGFYPYRYLLEQTQQQLAVEPGQRILDIGCGTGNLLNNVLAVKETTATGIDQSSGMLAVARSTLAEVLAQNRLRLIEANVAQGLALMPTASYDRIVSINVVYALDAAERTELWRQILRLLAPGGRAVITTSVRTGSWHIIGEHLRHAGWWQLLAPRLMGVFIIDSIINLLGSTGHFSFASFHTMQSEINKAGGQCSVPITCYGGKQHGVNVLFTVQAADV